MEVSAVVPDAYLGNHHHHTDANELKPHDADSMADSKALDRVCGNSSSGTSSSSSSSSSLGYACVNSVFVDTDHASHDIKKSDQTQFKLITIKPMGSNCDPNTSKFGILENANLFVKNLDDTIDNVKLNDIFSKYGNILSSKVAVSQEGKRKGYGFVQFDSEGSANAAIENMNGSTIEGKKLFVAKFVKKCDRKAASSTDHFTNLYFKNLDVDVSEELLQEKFSEFGKITSLTISKDDNGKSKGFGFVNFESADNAKKAMEAMNETKIGSKSLYVARAQKKVEREQTLRCLVEERRKEQSLKYEGSNVFIKNIANDVDDDELRDLFSKFGKIVSAKLMRDDQGTSKGFGFVCFTSPEEAGKAVSHFNGYMLHGKPLYVAIAQRKEVRQAYLQQQHLQRHCVLETPASAVPNGYSPIVVSQIHPPQEVVYHHQPVRMKQGWRSNEYAALPTMHAYQNFPTFPLIASNPPGHLLPPNQTRGQTMKTQKLAQGAAGLMPTPPPFAQRAPQPPIQSVSYSLKETNKKQRGGHSKQNGENLGGQNKQLTINWGVHDVNKSSRGSSATYNYIPTPLTQEKLEKQIIGDSLFPLITKLAQKNPAKITGMLMEMDKQELLLLLGSPQALRAKVNEAEEVLRLSETKAAAAAAGSAILKRCLLPKEQQVAVN